MSPEEAKELSRLLQKVAQLESSQGNHAALPVRSEPKIELRPSSARPNPRLPTVHEPEPITRRERPVSARPAYPTSRLQESARIYAEKQKKHRDDMIQLEDEPDPRRKKKMEKTRVVLWPEYKGLNDGDVVLHIERHYKKLSRTRTKMGNRWKILAAAERAKRRLHLRIAALRQFGPPDMFQTTAIYGVKNPRSDLRARIDKIGNEVAITEPRRVRTKRLEEQPWTVETCCGFSVQAAAHARGTLFIDTLASTIQQQNHLGGTTAILECFMDWLTLMGCPATTSDDLDAFEANRIDANKKTDEHQINDLLRHLLGFAAQDVAFGALCTAFRHDRRHPLLDKMATFIDDEHIDLQEIFLDTPGRVGRVHDDIRISHSDLRRGLLRLLSCLPQQDSSSTEHPPVAPTD